MISTFSALNIGKQGIDAARTNLEVTGLNITNASSDGYTKQRVDTYARAGTGQMRYATNSSSYVGEGVIIGTMTQVRDSTLDAQYRKQSAKLGEANATSEGLNDLGYIFDDATKEGFQSQISDLVDQLQTLSDNIGDSVSESLVKTSAMSLCQMFNQYSSQLQTVRDNQLSSLKDEAIVNANSYLSSIAELNVAIKSANISGDPSLDLIDKRNVLIDKLSSFANVEVATKTVDVGSGVTVNEVSINLIASNGDKFNLVNNGDYRQFALTETIDGKVGISLNQSNGVPVESSTFGSIGLTNGEISDYLSTGSFSGYLKVLNENGEYDTPASDFKGIGYYQNMLDTVANTFATVMNNANKVNGTEKPLFASNVTGGEISASNISLSDDWQKASSGYITNATQTTAGVQNKTDTTNVLKMISLLDSNTAFKTAGGTTLFEGTFNDSFTNMQSTLGLEIKANTRQVETYQSNVDDIDENRESVSGVSFDEEGVNLIMYNRAFSACSRFMTTIDEALNTIINSMGMVGR